MEKRIHIGLPDANQRRKLLELNIRVCAAGGGRKSYCILKLQSNAFIKHDASNGLSYPSLLL